MSSDQVSSSASSTQEQASTLSETTNETAVNVEIQWEIADDPANPRNWPMFRRVLSALIIASVGLLSSFAASILVPAMPTVMQEFGVSGQVISALPTSVYVLGLGFGPFVLSPLSEMYGRWIVYSTTLAAYTILQVGCALSNSMATLVVLRFLAGIAGSVAPSLGQASMSDIWDVKERGRWSAVLSLGPMFGPPTGNVISALILSGKSWPWIFWILAILSGFHLLLTLLFVRETYPPVLSRWRQEKLNNSASTLEKSSSTIYQVKTEVNAPKLSSMFGRSITRPLRFLGTSPVLIIISLFLAYTYGILFLILTSLPLLFDRGQAHSNLFNYGFNQIGAGLSYLGLALGTFVGCVVQMYLQTGIWNYLTKKNGEGRPEYRLLPMVAGTLFFPISLLWYGWTADKGVAWIVPILASGLLGWGMYIIFQSTSVYTVEAFIPYSASAIAAVTLLRCISGALFPLFTHQLFAHLGYGIGGTVLAVLALPAIPLPWLLYWHGTYLRQRWEFVP